MDDATKKKWKDASASAEAGADTLLGKVASSQYSWGIVLAALAVAFVAGAWIF